MTTFFALLSKAENGKPNRTQKDLPPVFSRLDMLLQDKYCKLFS